MGKEDHQILVIEDDASVAAGLVTGLKNAGYQVDLASDAAFNDDDLNRTLGIDGNDHFAVYMGAVGR